MHWTVCIIGPGHLSQNPRLVKEADCLSRAGFRVVTISGDFDPRYRRLDDEIVSEAQWRVIRVRHSWFHKIIARAAKAALSAIHKAGWPIPLVLAKLVHDRTTILTRITRRVRADLYIAHYIAALPAAAAAASLHGARLGYDAEDFHAGEEIEGSTPSLRRKLVETIERTFLPQCSHLTAASPLIANAYERLYGVSPIPILNVFSAKESLYANRKAHSGGISAYWFSQTIGLDRGLQSFIEAMALAQSDITLDVRGSNAFGHGDALLKLAEKLGLEGRIRLLPIAPPSRMVELAAQYDFGLSLEIHEIENRRLCLTNKIFTYLLAGIPIMMSDTPAQKALAVELKDAASLVNLDDVTMIAGKIDRWGRDQGALLQARQTALNLARHRFNWEIESRALVAAVTKTVGSPRTPSASA